MMRRQGIWLLLLLLMLLGAINHRPVHAQSPAIDPGAIDAFLAEQVRRHAVPGLAVAVVEGDQVVYRGGFGDVDAATPLPIASLSKAFTATALLQLVEAGQVELDAPVTTYLPWFTVADPDVSDAITVRQLLNQTSGLAEQGYPPADFEPEVSLESGVRDLVNAEPVAAPGTVFHYFNPNYEILGLIVQAVSGQPYEAYLREHIFDPLEMTGAATMPPTRPAELPQGHLTAFGFPVPADETVFGAYAVPAGGVVVSAEEMAHWLIPHLNGGVYQDRQILSPDLVALMQQPPETPDTTYAMGWKEETVAGVPVIEHGGDLNTYHAQIYLLPEQQRGVVILINQNGFLLNFTTYAALNQGLVSLLSGQVPSSGPSARLVGVMLLLVVIVSVGADLLAIRRMPVWVRRHRQRSVAQRRWRLPLRLLRDLIPLLLFLGAPALVWLLLGRLPNYGLLFTIAPDLVGWLMIAAALGTVKLGRRLWLLRSAAA